MNDAMYIGATGLHAQQQHVDTIANNLANLTTPGFKKTRLSFHDLMAVERSGTDSNNELDLTAFQKFRGNGVGVTGTSKIFTAGDIRKTDSPLDLAIRGDGFFEVRVDENLLGYTRNGSFVVNKDGFLANQQGYVLRGSPSIPPDAQEITIATDGKVRAKLSGRSSPVELGRIELMSFANPIGLQPNGETLFLATEASGEALAVRPGVEGAGLLAQGFLEYSNVNMVDEMVNLMLAQRAYGMSVKVVQAADEMLALTNSIRR